MDLYEKIKMLANEKKISIRQLEEALGFGNGVINRWRKNTPGIDKVQLVANYFDVSVDYLLGRTDNSEDSDSQLPPTDLDDALDGAMTWNGKPLTDQDKEAVRIFLQGRKSE